MLNQALYNLIEDHIELFSLPEIVIKLNSLLEKPDTSIKEIADLIILDAALTATLLKIVNSAYYNLSKPIDTISSAISIIGISELRDLITATKIINKFNNIPVELITPGSFWRHNIACAVASKVIATEFKIKNSERFFILGLLHDIGKLVMYLAQPTLSNHIINKINREKKSNRIDSIINIEKNIFGYSHDEVSSEILKKWKLPESIYIPCRYHHEPQNASEYKIETVILHLANSIANLIEKPFSLDDALPLKPYVWEILNANPNELISLTKISEDLYHDVASLFLADVAA